MLFRIFFSPKRVQLEPIMLPIPQTFSPKSLQKTEALLTTRDKNEIRDKKPFQSIRQAQQIVIMLCAI